MADDALRPERRRVRAISEPLDILARADARIALARALIHRAIDRRHDEDRVRTLHQVRAALALIDVLHDRAMRECCSRLTYQRMRFARNPIR